MSNELRFVGRFSGIVTYNDDTHDQFAAHIDERGNISVNGLATDSNQPIVEVQAGHNWLENLLALVSGTLALSPAGGAVKTVTDATMNFSGRVSRTDDTWEDFAVQYDQKAGGQFILNSSGTGGSSPTVTAYDEFSVTTLRNWFEALVGAGNVTVP
jgi:hypothetical protein